MPWVKRDLAPFSKQIAPVFGIVDGGDEEVEDGSFMSVFFANIWSGKERVESLVFQLLQLEGVEEILTSPGTVITPHQRVLVAFQSHLRFYGD